MQHAVGSGQWAVGSGQWAVQGAGETAHIGCGTIQKGTSTALAKRRHESQCSSRQRAPHAPEESAAAPLV